MAEPQSPVVPFRLALFLQAVSTRLTGAQLEECLREVTHFTGVCLTPLLDARQLQCVAAIVGDRTLSEVYGYEVDKLRVERSEVQRLAARCKWALRSLNEDGRFGDLKSELERLKYQLGWSVDKFIEKLGGVAEVLKAAADEVSKDPP